MLVIRDRKSYIVYFEEEDDPPGVSKVKPCSGCGASDHKVWKCIVFRMTNVDERWRIAKERRLCFRCLGAIIKARTAEDLRNVELMAVILVITVYCTILNK
jgi:hypothetical protein